LPADLNLYDMLEMSFNEGWWPDPSRASDLVEEYLPKDVSEIIDAIHRYSRYSDALDAVRDVSGEMTRADVKNAFISFLDKHYPMLLETIIEDEVEKNQFVGVLTQLLDEVIPRADG
jgi:hypothetical protein